MSDAQDQACCPSEGPDRVELDALLPLVYEELRAMAAAYSANAPRFATVQPTSLVHELYVNLAQGKQLRFESMAHFKALCSKVLRGILVDHARRNHAEKRGGGKRRVPLSMAASEADPAEVDVLELDEVLTKLHSLDERKARIVELRLFGGLTIEQVASVLEISRATIATEWRFARAWLGQQLLGAR